MRLSDRYGAVCFEDALGCLEVQNYPPRLDTPDLSDALDTRTEAPRPPCVALCADTSLFWEERRPLIISFLDQCSTLYFTWEQIKVLVMRGARDWTNGTSLRFTFLEDDDTTRDQADIRISFREKQTYSVVGTTPVKYGQPTMNLGFRGSITEGRIRRKVLHEFGHALGFQHEHSSPNFPLRLDRNAIIEHYNGELPDGISLSDWVDDNFMKIENGGTIEASPFDKHSIMMYTIQRTWNPEGRYLEGSTTLSNTDREMVRRWYPPHGIPDDPAGEALSPSSRERVRLSIGGHPPVAIKRQEDRINIVEFRCGISECQVRQCDTCLRIERYTRGW